MKGQDLALFLGFFSSALRSLFRKSLTTELRQSASGPSVLLIRRRERHFDRPVIESDDANRLRARALGSGSGRLLRSGRGARLRLFNHLLQFAPIEGQREF